MGFHLFDIAMLGIGAIFLLKGWIRGFLKEFLELVILIAVLLGTFFAFPWILSSIQLSVQGLSNWLSAFFLIILFSVLYILGRFFQWGLFQSFVFNKTGIERLLGGSIGLAKALCLGIGAVWILQVGDIQSYFPQIILEKSWFYSQISSYLANYTKDFDLSQFSLKSLW